MGSFLLVWGPSFGNPLDYPLGLLAEQEMLAFVFAWRSAVGVLIGAWAPSFVRTVYLDEEMRGIILIPRLSSENGGRLDRNPILQSIWIRLGILPLFG